VIGDLVRAQVELLVALQRFLEIFRQRDQLLITCAVFIVGCDTSPASPSAVRCILLLREIGLVVRAISSPTNRSGSSTARFFSGVKLDPPSEEVHHLLAPSKTNVILAQ
jgi:hypothetical protein